MVDCLDEVADGATRRQRPLPHRWVLRQKVFVCSRMHQAFTFISVESVVHLRAGITKGDLKNESADLTFSKGEAP
jgi:hypothetical protein